jgi:hypothetical protein
MVKECYCTLGLVLLLLATQVREASATTVCWTNVLGGLYSDTSNWSPNGIPATSDSVSFTNAGAYTFMVDTGVTNSAAFFHQGSVTQAILGGAWRLTNEWRVGEAAGIASSVTSVSGSLIVTNEAGTGVLSVGRNGTGELAIRGGNIVTDFLQASNGSRSLLTLAHGSLTTLHGMTVSNGTLVVGLATNAPFVWNITGGNNQILEWCGT